MTNISHLSTDAVKLPGTYSEFVGALKKPGEAILATLTAQQIDLVHMAIGLSGEVAELTEPFWLASGTQALINRANVVEELGDIEFFLEGICHNIGIKREIWNFGDGDEPRDELIRAMSITAGDILDTVKRNAIYGKDLDQNKLETLVGTFTDSLVEFYEVTNIDRAEVIAHNVDKLSKRYASLTYSDAQAQARADKA